MALVDDRIARLEARVAVLESGGKPPLPVAPIAPPTSEHGVRRRHGWLLLGLAVLVAIFAGPFYDLFYVDIYWLAWIAGLAGIVVLVTGQSASRPMVAPPPVYISHAAYPTLASPVANQAPPMPVRVAKVGTATPPVMPIASQPAEPLELHIGSYWFSRIGIVLLVIGIALFLIYALQYFGPAGRVMLGVLAGLVIAGIGLALRRTMLTFAQILIGGGGAVLYFTAFASYGFEASQILPTNATGQITALMFMLLIAAALYFIARKIDAAGLVAWAFLLGYLTVNLGDIAAFSLVALIFITIALIMSRSIPHRPVFLMLGTVFTYGTYARWLEATGGSGMDPATLVRWMSLLLGTYFALYTVALLFKPAPIEGADQSQEFTIDGLLIIVNGFGFVALLAAVLAKFLPSDTAWGMVLLIGGVTHLIIAGFSALVGEASRMYRWWAGFGLVAGLMALPLLHTGFTVGWLWLLFLMLLAALAVIRSSRFLLWFVYALDGVIVVYSLGMLLTETTMFMGTDIPERLVFFTATAIVGFGLSTYLRQARPDLTDPQVSMYLSGAAALVGMSITATETPAETLGLIAIPLAGLFFALGLTARDQTMRFAGYIVALFSVVWFLLGYLADTETALQFVPSMLSIGLLLVFAVWMRLAPPTAQEGQSGQIFSALACFQLWSYLTETTPGDILSLTWGILAAAFLVLGVAFRDRSVRWAGLVLFFLTIGKLFIVDTLGLDPLFRISSFIALGLILLLFSYGYTKYRDRLAAYL